MKINYFIASLLTNTFSKHASIPSHHLKLERHGIFVYYSCMATKTITLELDAYEHLKRAKRSPKESFSSVVRRAKFDNDPPTVAELLTAMERRAHTEDALLSDSVLNGLEAAQREPRYTGSKWDDSL